MRTILCLPGAWADRAAMLAACGRAGLAAAGAFIVDTLGGAHVEFELQPRDARMRDSFAAASGGEIEGPELDAIAEHQSVLYLLADGGDLDRLRSLVQLAVRLLPHGALGIKTESAGVAAPIERWMALSARLDPFGLMRCFVAVVTDERDGAQAFSCGMHNLGLPDAEVSGLPVPDAKKLLDAFNLYALIERPTLRDGQTFAAEAGGPGFRLARQPCTRFAADDPFHNPFGVVRLERA